MLRTWLGNSARKAGENLHVARQDYGVAVVLVQHGDLLALYLEFGFAGHRRVHELSP